MHRAFFIRCGVCEVMGRGGDGGAARRRTEERERAMMTLQLISITRSSTKDPCNPSASAGAVARCGARWKSVILSRSEPEALIKGSRSICIHRAWSIERARKDEWSDKEGERAGARPRRVRIARRRRGDVMFKAHDPRFTLNARRDITTLASHSLQAGYVSNNPRHLWNTITVRRARSPTNSWCALTRGRGHSRDSTGEKSPDRWRCHYQLRR